MNAVWDWPAKTFVPDDHLSHRLANQPWRDAAQGGFDFREFGHEDVDERADLALL
jgi:hypothetical protein